MDEEYAKSKYQPNPIAPECKVLWTDYALRLERLLLEIGTQVDEVTSKQIRDGIVEAYKESSIVVPADPSKF